MITAHHLVFGRKYGETFILDIQASRGMHYQFSTYEGDAYIDWGNGTYSNYSTPKLLDFTSYDRQTGFSAYAITMSLMATPIDFTTKVRLNKGFKDVYSIAFLESGYMSHWNSPYGKFFINDFGVFINQFKNLKTLIIDIARNNENVDRKNTIKGDLSQIPNSLEKITIGSLQFQLNLTDLYLNVSNFSNTSNLKVFKRDSGTQTNIGTFTAYGNLAKLPSQLYYFKLALNTGTFTYSGTKVWASSFDTLDIGNASLSATETDNLLIDMANSITTAIGSKIIRLANCYRTTASDTAVAYLQSLGFTITVLAVITPYELAYNFDGNFNEKNGVNNLVQNGTVTFTTDRKGGNTAIQFGSGNLKTQNNLPTSPTWSISFWINTTQTSLEGYLFSLTTNYYENNAFVSELNFHNINNLLAGISASPYNFKTLSKVLNDNNWHHIVLIFDKSKSANDEIQIYIDNVLQTLSVFNENNGDHSGNFISDKLYIGAAGSNMYKYKGKMSDIKIFNYPLTQTQITNLYNE